ncbi:GIY-YIG nuclease family protein [Pseudoalteromonas sp. SS15]|uniref:GIY-YIG nuclease family protein n=1 Tax=Pseudoalteromonas sp. SS15 TaxID=3139393 RepID=UPI003BA96E8E
MNKIGKIVVRLYAEMSESNKAYVLSKAIKFEEYEAFCKRLKNVNPEVLPYNFLITHLKKYCQFNTVNGLKKLSDIPSTKDKLRLVKVWVPNGRFIPEDATSFVPLGNEHLVTELISGVIYKIKERCMLIKWESIKSSLANVSVGNDEVIAARLDYEKKYTEPQDVYFVLDKNKSLLKIGVSKDVFLRLRTLKSKFTKDLEVLSVIKYGGVSLESRLHKHFKALKADTKGIGNEWFYFKKELHDFILELNNHVHKSDFIEKTLKD